MPSCVHFWISHNDTTSSLNVTQKHIVNEKRVEVRLVKMEGELVNLPDLIKAYVVLLNLESES